MVLIPRVPNIQNVLLKHDETSGTAAAGSVVYLSGDRKVAKVAASGNVPVGLLGQEVKANAAGLPVNFEFPGEIGGSQARLGDPVLVYSQGVFETTHYKISGSISAGAELYACVVSGHEGKLTNSGAESTTDLVAIALNSLTAGETAAAKPLLIKLVL